MDETTTCPGCGTKTFVGDRIRHAKGCTVAAALAAEKRARLAGKTPAQLDREIAIALTECSAPELNAALREDFRDHDE